MARNCSCLADSEVDVDVAVEGVTAGTSPPSTKIDCKAASMEFFKADRSMESAAGG